jgi:hypothetical protein
MATNSLTRNTNTNGQFVYKHTQIPDQNNAIGGIDGTIWTLFYGNSSRSGYNNPFVSSAEWKMLNLRLAKATYDGRLEFGFQNNTTSNPLSAICGFTVGIPPLYATHINTIARSVAYGFIHSPMTNNDSLWIVHENTLTQVLPKPGINNLSIVVKGDQVTYYAGATELAKRTISYTDAHLYVVAACGYEGNSVINLGLDGGSGFNVTVPDWDNKEIWILCNGLTNSSQNYYYTPEQINPAVASTFTRLDVKLQQNASFTIEFPDESNRVIDQLDNSYKTTPNDKVIGAQVPIVVKLKFNNFTEIRGLKIICQMTGTETSLTRFRANNTTLRTNLSKLEELQLRSSNSPTQSRFGPGIGIAPLPLQNLKSLIIEGSFDVNSIVNNLHKCINLEELYSDLSLNLYAFKVSAMRKLRFLYFSKFTGLGTTGIVFTGFRELFNPSRTSATHGLYYAYPNGNFALASEFAELAIAQVSAIKLYNNWIHTKLNDGLVSLLYAANYGFSFNGGSTPLGLGNAVNFAGSALVSSGLSFANNGTQCTITLKGIPNASQTNWTNYFIANALICFKKQPRYESVVSTVGGDIILSGWTGNSSSPELRRIGSPTFAWTSANNGTLTITFNLNAVKNQSSISGLTIAADNTYAAGAGGSYFTLTSETSQAFSSISIGDTVRVSSVSLPSNLTPSIVVDKSSNNQSVTVSKGTASDGITADLNNQTAVFNYEFPSTTTEAITTNTYTDTLGQTVIVTHNDANGVEYRNVPAAFTYLFEGVGAAY